MNVGSGYVASANGSSAETEAVAEGGLLHGPALSIVRERPEVLVGAAFAGGVIAALLLRRLGR